MKSLNETVSLMNSSDYKDRFIAEYWQTKIRYQKLNDMIIKYKSITCPFAPPCPISILIEQKKYMKQYLNRLEVRAEIECIDIHNIGLK